jgi:hypothetical protein
VVPLGHVVPWFCRTMTWLPLIAALVQHPSMTPELDTGLVLEITAAAATAVPAPSSSVTAPATMAVRVGRSLGLFMIVLLSRQGVAGPATAHPAAARRRFRHIGLEAA